MNTANNQTVEARHRILVAAGAALLAAGLILVMFVLPAEYAVDPLGTGARVGLLDLGVVGQQVEALSNAAPTEAVGEAPIVVPQDRAFKQETVEFKVAPREGMETSTGSTRVRRCSTRGRRQHPSTSSSMPSPMARLVATRRPTRKPIVRLKHPAR